MLALTLVSWISLLILAQLFCIWMYAGKLKLEFVTSSQFQYFVFIRVSDENPFSHRYVETN